MSIGNTIGKAQELHWVEGVHGDSLYGQFSGWSGWCKLAKCHRNANTWMCFTDDLEGIEQDFPQPDMTIEEKKAYIIISMRMGMGK